MKIYIAGPMTGIERFNFPAFDKARQDLKKLGYDAVSAVDMHRSRGFYAKGLTGNENLSDIGLSLNEIVRDDINMLLDCDCIYMLKGWRNSKGAKAEKAVAEWAGKIIMFEHE